MRYLARVLFPGLLVLITVVICFLNYTPGTFQTGWDTLHPEFNFAQQFSNEIFGAFRTDQGLGAVAAHAHMSELPRLLILWLFSFALPLSFLRYAVLFLCFILGPLGIYFFVEKILNKDRSKTTNYLLQISHSIPAFLAALFYIFNLETVQQFYVPFEMFIVEYAALGWIFLTAISYIEKPKVRKLALFALISFFASPMAYASVLWFAFFAVFLLFLATYYLFDRRKQIILPIVFLVVTTLIVNAYWLLPNLYFLATTAKNVSAAQTNKIFSDEAFLYNKQYGNIVDTAILKNFLFSWNEQLDINNTHKLLNVWEQHLSNPFTLAIGYLAFAGSVGGIIISILKKNKIGIALLPVFVLSLVMVMNMNPPFEFFFSYVRDNSSLFREGLRFPYTKFGPPLMFAMSIFFGIFADQIVEILAKVKKNTLRISLPIVFAVVTSLVFIWYGFPMFSGYLVDPQMRVKIPQAYFDLYKYMEDKPDYARIAPLPMQSIWGWQYNTWGYQGAGFLWFGLKQPVLARDFDRWNPSNEQYYREMSNALYSRDVAQFEAIARKYRVSYFLLDKSIYSPDDKPNALWHYETNDLFEKSKNIKLVKKFGDLSLYKVNDALVGNSFVQAPSHITFVGPEITGGFVDSASQDVDDYVVSDNPDQTYFGRDLVNRYDRVDPKNIQVLGDRILLRLGKNPQYSLTNRWMSNDILPEFIRDYYDLNIEKQGLPFTVDQDQFIYFPITNTPVNVAGSVIPSEDCGIIDETSVSEILRDSSTVTFRAKNGSSCGYIAFPTASPDFGNLLIVEAKNEEGLPIRLCISENITNRCGLYTVLDSGNTWKKYVFMVPPLPSGSQGYAVHFSTIGVGPSTSVNSIRNTQLIQIPYYRIENLSFIKDGFTNRPNGITGVSSKEINQTLYKVKANIKPNKEGLFALFKAYDGGWKAYIVSQNSTLLENWLPFVFGKEIKSHVQVNSWANGWLVEPQPNNNLQIVIVYLPQYLEYAGFVLLAGFGIFLLYRTVHHRYHK